MSQNGCWPRGASQVSYRREIKSLGAQENLLMPTLSNSTKAFAAPSILAHMASTICEDKIDALGRN